MPDPIDPDEVRRQIEQLLQGADPSQLTAVGDLLSAQLDGSLHPMGTVDLRKAALPQPVTFRITAALDDLDWTCQRTLDVRSDITLDVVHQVLQAAFSWTNSHLHRFTLGGPVFEPGVQSFLCPFDVEDGDSDGLPEQSVRLDETMQNAGDELHYVYDYGDSWDTTLSLEKVLPREVGDRHIATAIDAIGHAPPEDSRGTPGSEIAAAMGPFSRERAIADITTTLTRPYFALTVSGVDNRLLPLLDQLAWTPTSADLGERLAAGLTTDSTVDKRAALRPFLYEANVNPIPLTSAGYLPPDYVRAAADEVPTAMNWFGARNRETHAMPLLRFRESLQSVGLLRKSKQQLLITQVGKRCLKDPEALWTHLVQRLRPADKARAVNEALLLMLANIVADGGTSIPDQAVAEAMQELGWHTAGQASVSMAFLFDEPLTTTLRNLDALDLDRPGSLRLHELGPFAAQFARDVLTTG